MKYILPKKPLKTFYHCYALRYLRIHLKCLPTKNSNQSCAEVGFCLTETDFARPVLSAVLTKNKCDMPKNSIEFISL